MANGEPNDNRFIQSWCAERHDRLDHDIASLENKIQGCYERITMVDNKHDAKFNKVLFFLIANLCGIITTLITVIIQMI